MSCMSTLCFFCENVVCLADFSRILECFLRKIVVVVVVVVVVVRRWTLHWKIVFKNLRPTVFFVYWFCDSRLRVNVVPSPETNIFAPENDWKWMVSNRTLIFLRGPFSGAILVFGFLGDVAQAFSVLFANLWCAYGLKTYRPQWLNARQSSERWDDDIFRGGFSAFDLGSCVTVMYTDWYVYIYIY